MATESRARTQHDRTLLMLELPFTLNELPMSTVDVPIPTEYLHVEDAALSATPRVMLTLHNVDRPAVDNGGVALSELLRVQGLEDVAREVLAKRDSAPSPRTLLRAVTTSCRLHGEKRHPSDQAAILSRVLYALNRYLHAYIVSFEDEEVTFVSREMLLWPSLYVTLDSNERPTSRTVMRPVSNSLRYRPNDVPEVAQRLLEMSIRNEALEHPMDSVSVWRTRARRAREVHGDYNQAVVCLQTSAEAMLFGVFRLGLIDEGLDAPAILDRLASTPFSGLVESQPQPCWAATGTVTGTARSPSTGGTSTLPETTSSILGCTLASSRRGRPSLATQRCANISSTRRTELQRHILASYSGCSVVPTSRHAGG